MLQQMDASVTKRNITSMANLTTKIAGKTQVKLFKEVYSVPNELIQCDTMRLVCRSDQCKQQHFFILITYFSYQVYLAREPKVRYCHG